MLVARGATLAGADLFLLLLDGGAAGSDDFGNQPHEHEANSRTASWAPSPCSMSPEEHRMAVTSRAPLCRSAEP